MKAFFQNFLAITKKTGIVASMGARYGATIDIDNKIWCWVAFNDIFTEEELLVTNKIMEDEFGYTITYHKDINQNG